VLIVDTIVNIAGYRFVDLPDRDNIRDPMLEQCLKLDLKGSILLSQNGINFFLAGIQPSVDAFLQYLELDERFIGIDLKISYTDYQPFRRMLVKRKKEIISLGLDDIRPSDFTGPHISPTEFKRMLDDDEDIVILDTRNDYETRIGSFEGAIDLDIQSFRNFPEAIETLPEEYKSKTFVMYCTGGIRCEKASAVMLNAGFEDVRQLDGGILAYLQEYGESHWNGDCFVFDQRVAVDHNLRESKVEMCFKCREPLSQDQQQSADYIVGEHCPYCISK
jgi:UPF0176 protein|tara:strand:- start:450 stop:1277 length:828 start_codon:yes stop_codon:yes gene_type:complete